MRDVANYQYAMVLKSRIVGENPLNVDYLFEKIAQFGGVARQAGGVAAIEMALWDIVGKVYSAPVYQMLCGKWREKIRLYADTPQAFAAKAKGPKDMGLTWIKVDIGTDLLKGKRGTLVEPADQSSVELDKHCAVATRNFLAFENHSHDVQWWQDMLNEIDKPIIKNGYIPVPDTPGLGVTLNDEVVKQHLAPGVGYFEPTPMWDEKQSFDDQTFS